MLASVSGKEKNDFWDGKETIEIVLSNAEPLLTDALLMSIHERQKIFTRFALDDALPKRINEAAALIFDVFNRRGRVFICGNGGSLCQAMHFAEECTGRFRKDRQPLPVIALADASHITCVANDFGFDEVFARPIEALGQIDDVLLVLSTSGNSPNILRAIESAKSRKMKVIGLLGRSGGQAGAACDLCLLAPGETSDTIQEIHQVVLHVWVEEIERKMGLN